MEHVDLPIGVAPADYRERPGNKGAVLFGLFFLGLVAWIVTPSFWPFGRGRHHGGGQLTACKSNCKNLATALEMYASDFGGLYPQDMARLTSGNYLKSIPTCPAAGKDTYSATYRYRSKPDNFSFFCAGDNHEKAYSGFDRPSINFPKYNGELGLIDHP
jgi:hypothetical protein